MDLIVHDPAYAGMPDLRYPDGRIQWEAPSNRRGGQFKDSHHRRREWWAGRARDLGISTQQDQWISRVAKAIHPLKSKPCKRCGEWMDIRYVYPASNALKALGKLPGLPSSFQLNPLEDIFSLVTRLHGTLGVRPLDHLPKLLKTAGAQPPPGTSLHEWLLWLENVYVPQEPRTLSPGAMSNAPDRLDGFHSFNRCCRSTADTGRSAKNLRSYSTDRRVFEYWAAGDWIAADRMMGQVRSALAAEPCVNGHPGPCQPDHIGPISLGFSHHPHFRLLCGSCNSAKNNRMSFADVSWLRAHEVAGHAVISWHSRQLWDVCKQKVSNAEHALRLSKLLRDNRHSLMHALSAIAGAGHYAFLVSLLELEHADHKVEYEGLAVRDHVTTWQHLRRTKRETRYAAEQKARRSRVAFAELHTYFSQTTRNVYIVRTERSQALLSELLTTLNRLKPISRAADDALQAVISGLVVEADGLLKAIHLSDVQPPAQVFAEARALLTAHMDAVGDRLSTRWDDERFTRELRAA